MYVNIQSEDKKQIGVIMTDHWQNIHGPPTDMLYYAETSRAVLNAKVCCLIQIYILTKDQNVFYFILHANVSSWYSYFLMSMLVLKIYLKKTYFYVCLFNFKSWNIPVQG